MIPYGRQDISEEDIKAVERVLRSDFLTQGPAIPAFEKAFCDYTGADHAVAVNSATSALHIACLALDLGPGDLLWTVPNTFVASANCAYYCGATADFVDIDPDTRNMDVGALEAKLEAAAQSGNLPKIVIPVHFAGQSCGMKAINELAKRYGFRVIEDASHAVGGSYLGDKVGNCQFSDVTIFSFHPVKIITTGEGGLALTNDPELAKRMALYRSHGVTRDTALMETAVAEPWYYEQVALGLNYRTTDLQAALGLSQMSRLDEFTLKRNELADAYDTLLSGLALGLPKRSESAYSAWHLYTVLISEPAERDVVFNKMREKGIGVNVHYIPVHLQPFYKKQGFKEGMFPVSEAHGRNVLTLPLHPNLSEAQQKYIAETLSEALS
ncbi:UDP-4-amino-4,6-dideoxy-N-acetyl-beta-L-altrosamine transaminase [Pseudovibrio sp. JE062]|uniref:UDP-4-amino-4, 6-dideoxy-N-acetyl-beta-L-altrosamine transaminase n=1 Tax=Pseudovibrio sp. JE062 TaxID=439495 RepID=UPI000186F655|nr:UDP-4-amino-4,6-dideoxy-N-acetyl-beta-L-altrosamine transaminase [Pseudovibrio sp. JE062]EEA93477.1 UDP-4-amino-4-deoxy-L-arabinose--oxoglutarate aminotransferase [Pseudovibrio sp. JE062]